MAGELVQFYRFLDRIPRFAPSKSSRIKSRVFIRWYGPCLCEGAVSGTNRRSYALAGLGNKRFGPDRTNIMAKLTQCIRGGILQLSTAFLLLCCSIRGQAAVDPAFKCVLGGESGEVYALVKQPDGKYLVGGSFTSVKGVLRYGIARLSPSGAVDATFDAGIVQGGTVYKIALLSDGRVLMAGGFTNINASPRFGLACLKTDGSLDSSFNPNAGVTRNGKPFPVTALAVQPDGRIMIGGYFDAAVGVPRKMIARLNPSGTLDDTFVGEITSGSSVYDFALQNDGKILVAGGFSKVSDTNRQNLARLLSDGRLDTTFDPLSYVSGTCNSILPLNDGRIMVAGNNFCRRLSADGKSMDSSFIEPELGLNSWAYTVVGMPGGGYALGGEFYQSGNRFNLAGVAFGAKTYVAVGDAVVAYEDNNPNRPDLFDFKTQGGLLSLPSTSVAFGSNNFVSVSRSSSVAVSISGTNWTSRSTDALQGFNRVTFANGAFVAVGPNGTIRTSLDDGATWRNPASTPTTSELQAVTASPGRWVAVGGTPGVGVIITSTDASTWSSTTPVTNLLYGVAYGNNQFVAVGENGGIYISPDGLSWSWVTNRYPETLYSVAYGNGLFIAVGDAGRILYSPNGTGWTNVYNYSMQSPRQPLRAITFANTKFVAVGGNGTVLVSDPAYAPPNLYLVERRLLDWDSLSLVLMDDNGLVRTNFNSGINDLVSNYKETVRAVVPETSSLVVAGNFVKVSNTNSGDIARLTLNGALDLSMPMDMGVASEGVAKVIVSQSDGKILVGGDFTSVNGLERPRLARVNPDGSVDSSFNAGTNVERPITSIVPLSSGQIMVGGNGNVYGSRPVARLNADGSVDPGFRTTYGGSTYNDIISAMAIQADGKVVLNGSSKRVARLNTNGTDDVTFNIGTGVSRGYVSGIAVQPDGKILVAGSFTNFNGRTANGLVRLWPAGTNDEPFIVNYGVGTTQGVSSVIVRTVGAAGTLSILLGGPFTNLSGLACGHVARLSEDGIPDPAFAANTVPVPSFRFDALAAMADSTSDTIYIAGALTNASGTPQEYFGFLDAKGALRTGFYTSLGDDGRLFALGPFSENKVLAGGLFRTVDGNRWLSLVSLQTQNEAGGLAQWRTASFTPAELADPSISGDNADPDHDGLVNLVEYALNSNPKDPQPLVMPAPTLQSNPADGKSYLVYSYRRRLGASGVQYAIEVSNDLRAWEATSSRIEEIGVTKDLNGVTETVTVRIKPPIADQSAAFVRLTIKSGG